MSYSGVWTLSEQKNGKVHSVSFELLNRGKSLAEKLNVPLSAVLLTAIYDEAEIQELIYRGADIVYVVVNPLLENFLVEPYQLVLDNLIDQFKPEIFIAAATTSGRTIMPYLAIKLHAGLTADCTTLDIEPETNNLLQQRPAIGGNILATIKTPIHRPQMATVRPKSMKPAPRDTSRTGDIIRVDVPDSCFVSRVKFESFVADKLQDMPIEEADTVVACGKALGKEDNMKCINELAGAVGAAVGSTREVVDRGWLPYSTQIGLSGKTVAPRLYFAVGISGAIQHLAGMQTAETIIAVNNDPDAQIFNVADFGIVGDLFEVIPAMAERLKKEAAKSDEAAQ
ncbi:electron transfer flavoprotein subunit alpha/FixB family protein [bacterium]|nr:electron transfer flavoprotein subunit alpha/FixB family protein [bacterium]